MPAFATVTSLLFYQIRHLHANLHFSFTQITWQAAHLKKKKGVPEQYCHLKTVTDITKYSWLVSICLFRNHIYFHSGSLSNFHPQLRDWSSIWIFAFWLKLELVTLFEERKDNPDDSARARNQISKLKLHVFGPNFFVDTTTFQKKQQINSDMVCT